MDTTRAQESANRKIGYVPLRWAGWLLVLTSMLASLFAPISAQSAHGGGGTADVGRSDGNGANPIVVVGALCKNMAGVSRKSSGADTRECSRAGYAMLDL
jgi:hypothetical protein